MYDERNIAREILEDPELMQIVSICSSSTRMMAKVFFPERFYADFTPVHEQIFEHLDSDANRVAIAAPRGFGKTSILSLAFAARYMLFGLSHYIVYINMSETAAVAQTENLKRELITNRMIKQFFGRIKASAYEDMDEVFSKKAWVTSTDCMVLPRGSGQQVRGLLYKNYRPGLIIIDDLEDPETLENDEIRKKRKNWFHADVLKAVSRLEKDWKVVYIDTLKHEDSLLEELLQSDEWSTVRLEACDDDYNPTAPSFMSREDILKEVEYHRKHGIMDVFYREYRNLPISTEDAAFRQEYFKYYNETDIEPGEIEETVIVADPAKTAKMSSADSALVAVGIDRIKGRLYVRDVVSGKMYPDEFYDQLFMLKARFKVHAIGVEVTGLEEFIKQPITNEMIRRGQPFEPVWLVARGGSAYDSSGKGKGKIRRIAQLVPYYRQGYIYHNSTCCGTLEAQLMSFPRSKRWDCMDALSYIIEMLELGDRYFEPLRPEDEEGYDPESEFRELQNEYEPALEGWRI